MKILINDYSGHPFPFELSQLLSKKYEIVHSYAQYFETPKANFKSLAIIPIIKPIGSEITLQRNLNAFIIFLKIILKKL